MAILIDITELTANIEKCSEYDSLRNFCEELLKKFLENAGY
jgi:hypothetical protein